MPNAIELHGVTKRFGRQIAVDHLDLQVPEGTIYGFIGPNGSGKTTTIRMILRIFQPDQGTVHVLGKSNGTVADDRLGYLPEERGLYKRMKVREILRYYARLKGFYQCNAEIEDWLERLGASEWSNKRIDALSKGMAQKIQFISAVVARPQLVILDEPFSGLDPVNMEALRSAVLALRERGTTIVFSTHDMSMAEQMCDTIFMIFRGKKVLDGTLDAIQAQYPADRARAVLSENGALPQLAEVADVEANGRVLEFRMNNPSEPNHYLRQLMQSHTVESFQVIRPSLHDIFLRIARPEGYVEPDQSSTEVAR
ncbi:MAG: ATP-binding cassette domain-containing protein [Pirellulaceae bacterium]|nr:ATP-binding cassette domain-containing protein [Pirellulaceae bacterium]